LHQLYKTPEKILYLTRSATLRGFESFIHTLFSNLLCGEGVYRAISYAPRHDGAMKHQKEENFVSVHDRF
jgi:hypothetical protein